MPTGPSKLFCVSKQRVIHVTITEQYSIKHTASYIFDTFLRIIYDFSLSLQGILILTSVFMKQFPNIKNFACFYNQLV